MGERRDRDHGPTAGGCGGLVVTVAFFHSCEHDIAHSASDDGFSVGPLDALLAMIQDTGPLAMKGREVDAQFIADMQDVSGLADR